MNALPPRPTPAPSAMPADASFSAAGEEDPSAFQGDAPSGRPDEMAAPAAARRTEAVRVSAIEAITGSRLFTVAADTLLGEVAAGMTHRQLGVAVVCTSTGTALGIVTEKMLLRQLGLRQADLFATRAADLMSTALAFCTPEQSLSELMDEMHAKGWLHALVLGPSQEVQGVVHLGDGLRALLLAGHAEEAFLRRYVMGIGYQ